MKKLGVKIDTGSHVKTGVEAQAGAEVRASAKALVGPTVTSGSAVAFTVSDTGGNVLAAKKNFDIKCRVSRNPHSSSKTNCHNGFPQRTPRGGGGLETLQGTP